MKHLTGTLDDIRFAARLLRKTPGFSLLAVLILALGTGANVAMFSVIDGVMLRSAFEHPEGIARLLATTPTGSRTGAVPIASFERVSTHSDWFSAIARFTSGSPVVSRIDVPRRAQVECVSASMADVLGTRPIRGRWFSSAEDQPGGPPVALVSYAFWRGALNADPNVVGRVIALDDVAVTVIGVMPAGFDGPLSLINRDMWAPVGQITGAGSKFGCRPQGATVTPFVRLRQGVSLEQVMAAINPAATGVGSPAGQLVLSPLLDETVGDLRGPLIALGGAVIAVLLIACANVANLHLERLIGRRREIAVKLALGASRARVVRQTVAESVILSAAGVVAGVVIAYLTLDVLVALLPRGLPHAAAIAINMRVLVTTISLALIAGAGVSLVPALQSSSPQLRPALTENDRTSTPGNRRLRSILVVTELALGVALLIGALLMVRTFLTLRPDAPGFDPKNKTMAIVRLPQGMTDQARQQFVSDVSAEVSQLPGIRGVAATTTLPMYRSLAMLDVTGLGSTAQISTVSVSANYFDLMSIPLTRGRGFTAADGPGAPGVVIVNEEFVRRRAPGRSPLGEMITIKQPSAPSIEAQVVGVVGDLRMFGMDTRRRPEVYLPMRQSFTGSVFFVVSGSTEALAKLPPSIRAIAARLIPGQLVDRIENYEAFLGTEVSQPRFGAWLLGLFAGLAVLLGAIGLGATLAWSVAERRREIGVRMALGARAQHVAALVVRQMLALSVIGIAIGLGLAWAGTRLLQEWLYGVTATDVRTYLSCAFTMLVVAALAAYVPVRRATRVDPLVAMRQ